VEDLSVGAKTKDLYLHRTALLRVGLKLVLKLVLTLVLKTVLLSWSFRTPSITFMYK
jgi:hypothetical protein